MRVRVRAFFFFFFACVDLLMLEAGVNTNTFQSSQSKQRWMWSCNKPSSRPATPLRLHTTLRVVIKAEVWFNWRGLFTAGWLAFPYMVEDSKGGGSDGSSHYVSNIDLGQGMKGQYDIMEHTSQAWVVAGALSLLGAGDGRRRGEAGEWHLGHLKWGRNPGKWHLGHQRLCWKSATKRILTYNLPGMAHWHLVIVFSFPRLSSTLL